MPVQPRVTKVLAALLVSMTAGAIVLMALGNNPPRPDLTTFTLAKYRKLKPIEETLFSRAKQNRNRWNIIEIYYSNTTDGNKNLLTSLYGLASSDDLDCHFVICNGMGAGEGDIESTEKWQKQWSIIPGKSWYGTEQTLRICLVADGSVADVKELQKARLNDLLEELTRKFEIKRESIYYPSDWQ